MLKSTFGHVKTVLCLGAHADDIEIGCGGTILRLLQIHPGMAVHWHVFGAPAGRRLEARRSAREFLASAGTAHIQVAGFRESYFPGQWVRIKQALEQVRRRYEPDLIFTHWRDDRHQDHRVLSDLTWNAFRDHLILEYEIPKYDGDLGNPNVYVGLNEEVTTLKISAILRHFRSQASKHWFTEDTFRSIMRLRGIECGPGTVFAEGFYGRKLVL